MPNQRPVVKYTLIRHAESTDNTKGLWAGWRDKPLSNHGIDQAEALARSFSQVQFTVIFSSDLERASTTANKLLSSQRHASPLSISQLLREQNFGAAEGRPYGKKRDSKLSLKQHFAKGKFPMLYARKEKFPGGESLDEVRARAEMIWKDKLEQYTRGAPGNDKIDSGGSNAQDVHIAIISHGIFITELVSVILAKGGLEGIVPIKEFKNMKNTGWTRFSVAIDDKTEAGGGKLLVKVIGVNRTSHLNGISRQKGGIGSLPYDPKQKDIRTFFGNRHENATGKT